jgi:hypothetical protein
MDYSVYERLKELEHKYYELFTKYPSIANRILDSCCPPFYRNEINEIQRIIQKKDYHEVSMLSPVYDFIRYS